MNNIKRFDIIFVDFGNDNIGSEQGGKRPAVVLQNDIGNARSSTTIVCPLTKSIKHPYQPTHFLVRKNEINGLKFDSMVLGECVRQISKQRIISKIGRLNDKKDMKGVFDAFCANIGEGEFVA